MAFNNKLKHKSRLPVAPKKGELILHSNEKNCFRSGSASSDNVDELKSENQNNAALKQNKSKKVTGPQVQPVKSKAGPLAKVMQKRPPQFQERQSETYAEEKIESVSQKMRGKSQADHKKRKEEMELQLQEAEAQLIEMKYLLEKREQMFKENEENSETKKAELGERIASQDGKLIKNGIDPVTGEKVPVSEKDQEKMEKTRKFTKKYIQQMREKLQQMNSQTETLIENMEATVNYLDSLGDASDRAGPISEDVQKIVDDTGADKFIAMVYAENVKTVPKCDSEKEESSEEMEKDRRSGRETPDNEDDQHNKEEVEKGESEEEKQELEENTSSKVFLTARGMSDVQESDLLPDDESGRVNAT